MTWRLHLLRIRPWLLFAVLPALLVALGSAAYTSRQPKQYTATSELYVQQTSSAATGTAVDIYASQALAATYARMVTNGPVLQAANLLLQKKYPGYSLAAHPITATAQISSQLMDISLTDTNPQRAVDALNALTASFIKYIHDIQVQRFAADQTSMQNQIASARKSISHVTAQLVAASGDPARQAGLKTALSAYETSYQSLLSQLEQFEVSRDAMVNSLSVSSPAAAYFAGPSPLHSALLYGFLALLILAGAVYLYFYLDDSLRGPEEVEAAAGAPLLGTVQHFDPGSEGGQLVTATRPRSPASEAYRMVRTNIQFANIDKPIRRLVITSATSSEGKSTTASNLARVFAESGQPVTLLDADLRRPSLHRVFELPTRQQGLTNMLVSPSLNGHGLQPTGLPGLNVVASGPLPPNPTDLLGSERMHRIMDHLQAESGMLIIDSPPVLSVADAVVLAAHADGVVLVVDPRRSKRRELVRTREAIEAVGGHIIGVVINGLSAGGSGYYYYYSNYYHYYGRYGDDLSNRAVIEPPPPAALPRD